MPWDVHGVQQWVFKDGRPMPQQNIDALKELASLISSRG